MAEHLYRRALHIDETTPGQDQLGLIRDLRNLANMFQEQVCATASSCRGVTWAYLFVMRNFCDENAVALTHLSEAFALWVYHVHKLERSDEPGPRTLGNEAIVWYARYSTWLPCGDGESADHRRLHPFNLAMSIKRHRT